TESDTLDPTSPYAASKAAADLLVLAYVKTYRLPALITRCSNNYGPLQFPEKAIPLFITSAIRDAALPVYGDGSNVREWLHLRDTVEWYRMQSAWWRDILTGAYRKRNAGSL